MKASQRCPHKSQYGRCMNGECVRLRLQGRVKGVAEMQERDAREAEDALRRGLRR